jgi:hypothetical protein
MGEKISHNIKENREIYRPKKPLTPNQLTFATEQWASSLIRFLWYLSEAVGAYRNQVVHGKLEEFRQSKAHKVLQEEVTKLYEQFQTDPYMLPHTRRYLFNKPLNVTLAMEKESMACWIKSVKEGIYTREHQERLAQAQIKRTTHNFFKNKVIHGKLRNTTTSVWKAPFSTSYYSKHRISHSSIRKTSTKDRSKAVKERKRPKKKVCPMRSLDTYGFSRKSRNNKPKAQLGVAGKLDFSSTVECRRKEQRRFQGYELSGKSFSPDLPK